MKTSTQPKLAYEPEADVLSWEISGAPIDYATEVGNMIVHFTKDNTPVLIEVLNAKNFMQRAKDAVSIKKLHRQRA